MAQCDNATRDDQGRCGHTNASSLAKVPVQEAVRRHQRSKLSDCAETPPSNFSSDSQQKQLAKEGVGFRRVKSALKPETESVVVGHWLHPPTTRRKSFVALKGGTSFEWSRRDMMQPAGWRVSGGAHNPMGSRERQISFALPHRSLPRPHAPQRPLPIPLPIDARWGELDAAAFAGMTFAAPAHPMSGGVPRTVRSPPPTSSRRAERSEAGRDPDKSQRDHFFRIAHERGRKRNGPAAHR